MTSDAIPATPAQRGGRRAGGVPRENRPGEPLVSVITVVYNGANHLAQTIESVLSQRYENLEYVVIDGGSSDGTVDILRRFDNHIDYWLSERDYGLYDAMNKGLALASGELTHLLNADDYYHDPNVVSDVVAKVLADGLASIYAGDTLMMADDRSWLEPCTAVRSLYYRIPFMHPSCFIPRALYERHGRYDLKYRIAADAELLMRFMKHGVAVKPLQRTCTVMRHGGLSSRRFGAARLEYARLFQKYHGQPCLAVWGYLKSVILYRLSWLRRALSGGQP